ncbi:hypothetical protein Aduo_001613 [Ancylostoma duodenale]
MADRRSLPRLTEDDDLQLYKAHERIRALNRELLMQDDASAQISALRKKIAESKERAQGIVTMANKRIAYLTGLWKESSETEPSKGSVSDVSSAPRTAGKSGTAAPKGSEYDAVFSRAVTALDAMSTSTRLFGECRKESSRLANELRGFLATMQKGGKCDAHSLGTGSQPVSQEKEKSTAVEVASAVSGSATSTAKASEPGNTPMILPKQTAPSRSDADTSKTGLSTKGQPAEQLPGLQKKAEPPELQSTTKKPTELKTAVGSPTKATTSKKAPETQRTDIRSQLTNTGRASAVPEEIVQKTPDTPKSDTVPQLTTNTKTSTSTSHN